MATLDLGSENYSAARGAISDVLHRYAFLAREGADLLELAALFTPDGVFVLPDGSQVPPAELYRIADDNPPVYVRHHITTIAIEFTDESNAVADSFFMAFSDKAQPDHWGRWHDTLTRDAEGRWLLTSKQPIVEGQDPHGDWAKSRFVEQ